MFVNLKQSIVIVNEYTTKTKSGGTRGGTPGQYVVRYMCRDGATEDLTPVRLEDSDDISVRYKKRKDASDKAKSVGGMKKDMKNAQGFGGLAFGNGDPSLSHQKVIDFSKEIQDGFNNGKTVMKTVLSFSEEYLRETGVLSSDFEFTESNGYRGSIDQMKLRTAIMDGLDKMSAKYDDLRYIGVLQVDTRHVHCHLAMYDRGRGQIQKGKERGKQRGYIGRAEKSAIRRGIDMSLDEAHTVQYMSSNIGHDRRNVKCFVKKFTHRAIERDGFAQFVIACLPDNRNLWRAGSNDKRMRKANTIVGEYVSELLRELSSGYRDALMKIDEYARGRQRREGLSDREYRQLYFSGRDNLFNDCVDSVYSVLKQIPKASLSVRTPVLDVMSMEYEAVAAQADSDPMIEFGFKLRSYSSRLTHHRKERDKYHEAVKSYEDSTNADPASRPLYEFMKFEEEYNSRVMCKYQHFLSFLPDKSEYEDEFNDLMGYRGKMISLRKLKDDPAVKKMNPDNAEDYGLRAYEAHGGRFAATAPQILERRLELMHEAYRQKEDAFRYKLENHGLSLETDSRGARVANFKKYEFDDVKALDIHHLGYDFSHDIEISKVNIDNFVAAADRRYELYESMKSYLERSGQGGALSNFAVKDIELMKDVADSLKHQAVLPAARPVGGKAHGGRTIPLGHDLDTDISFAVRNTLNSIEFA